MISIEEMERMLDELTEELPEEFFRELNGGIMLLPEAKLHPQSIDNDLFILGEYNRNVNLGRYIVIYYGSFMNSFRYLPPDEIKNKLRSTLRHEFRHHIEFLSGVRDLEIEDDKDINEYLKKKKHS